MVVLVARPGGNGVSKAVGVQRAVDDTLVVDAELPGCVDSGQTVDADRGARVDVDDLVLAVLCALASGVVAVEERIEARAWRSV